jgi:hypothetical protein
LAATSEETSGFTAELGFVTAEVVEVSGIG